MNAKLTLTSSKDCIECNWDINQKKAKLQTIRGHTYIQI